MFSSMDARMVLEEAMLNIKLINTSNEDQMKAMNTLKYMQIIET